jgi:DNA-binding Lrp family transcriptional regulator
MVEKLDILDLRILEGLGVHGSRNVTDVARKLGIPTETMRKRLKRMPSRIFLRFYVNIYHTNLGLKKALVFAEAIPGYEDLLFSCLKANDFWMYVSRCYGMNEGCHGLYIIPKDHWSDFERFAYQLEKLGVARNVQIFWSTCFQSVHSRTNWFDEQSKNWAFQWDKWIEEIPNKDTKLPYTLIDPEDWPVRVDEIDVFILKEMEKNPRISLSDLAKMLGVSQQLVEYHYRKHVLERGLIESFDVFSFHFDTAISDMFVFIFKFDSMERLARFAKSLLDKPFVGGLGKILGENMMVADVYLPRLEFRNFIDALAKLIRNGLLQSYNYVILDLRKVQRQTISYEYFKDGSWIYDHNKHIQNLKDLVEGTELEQGVDSRSFFGFIGSDAFPQQHF